MHTNKKKKQNLLCKLLWNLLLNPLNLTWPCTKVSQNILGHFLWKPVVPDLPLHQSLPGLLRNLLRTAVEPCLEPVELDLGTFSGTFLSPEPGWTWPGACNSAHRSYSALKAPLFYAVGKKLNLVPPKSANFILDLSEESYMAPLKIDNRRMANTTALWVQTTKALEW